MKLVDVTSSVEITLPSALLWEDEMEWNPTSAKTEYSLTGSLIFDSATKQTGRTITLSPPANDMAWVPRSTLLALKAWLSPPKRMMQLHLEDGSSRVFNVLFNHEKGALEGAPVKGYPEYDDGTWYSLTLRLLEVPADF